MSARNDQRGGAVADGAGAFRPAPRVKVRASSHDRQNARLELEAIAARVSAVKASDRESFYDGSVSYDAASMAVIRLASLLERPAVAEAGERALTPQERSAIRTTRSIAAHGGYRDMNDDLFWLAVTVRIPGILRRLEQALEPAPELP